MKIYLLRHGERGHGEKQDTLTENGLKQAIKTANFLKSLKISKIIIGDSERAKKTAKPIVKKIKSEVEITPLVNEQSLGVL